MQVINLPRQRVSPCLSIRFCLTLFDRFCLKENSSWSSEFLCMTVGCRGDSAFALRLKIWLRVSPGCQMHLDRVTMKTCPQFLSASHPHHVFKICFEKMLVTGFPVLVMNSQLLFADSLTSTLLDWLGYATGLSVIARLHFPAVMMLEVMYQTSLTRKTSSINLVPFLQLVLPVIDGISLLAEEFHDKFFQNSFEANLVRISLISI